MKLTIKQDILTANDRIAKKNQIVFDKRNITAINVMASPGAGKTSFILAVSKLLATSYAVGVIEGDIASRIDTEKIISQGYPAVQINTGGNCHLDARMVQKVLPELLKKPINLVFIENVGNLICPANVNIGSHKNVVLASVPEGHDKPYKYPGMFAKADLVLVSKYDLIPIIEFDLANFIKGVRLVNTDVPILPISNREQKGIKKAVYMLRGYMTKKG